MARSSAMSRPREVVEIEATGSVTGDIKAPRLAIADGGYFRGRVEMSLIEARHSAEEPRTGLSPRERRLRRWSAETKSIDATVVRGPAPPPRAQPARHPLCATSRRRDEAAGIKLLHVPVSRHGDARPSEVHAGKRCPDPVIPEVDAQRESRHAGKRQLAPAEGLETECVF